MATTTDISLHVIKLPNDGQPTGVTSAGIVQGISVGNILNVTAATAAQTAAYPGTATVIISQYWRGQQRLTGTYYVVETVAQVGGLAGNALQSVHVLRLPYVSGAVSLNTPLFASTGNIYLINNSLIDGVETAATALAATYTNVVAQINTRFFNNNQQFASNYLVTETVAAVIGATGTFGGSGSGQTTLVAGTKAITIQGLTTSSLGFVQLVTPNTASLTIQYQAVCTANTLTIQANVAAGTINTADISTLNYFVI